MYVKILSIIWLCIALLSGCSPSSSDPLAGTERDLSAKAFDAKFHDWPHSVSDVTPDPSITYGRLDNGLRYIILPKEGRNKGVSLRLLFNVGAADEAEEHYGIAHFLEHMAFNGSKKLNSGEFVKRAQDQGLTFGPDVNAFTGYKQTFYMLDFPKNTEKNVETGLFLFSEIAQNLTLEAAEIQRERGVVLAELELRDTPKNRAQSEKAEFLFPMYTYLQHGIAGTAQTLTNIDQAVMGNFYKRHYRPENAVIIITGKVDVKSVSQKIEKLYADWLPLSELSEIPQTNFKPIPESSVDAVKASAERRIGRELTVFETRTASILKDTRAGQKKMLAWKIANEIVERRLRQAISEDDKITWGRVEFKALRDIDFIAFRAGARSHKKAVELFEIERKRVIELGFMAAEIRPVIMSMRRKLEDSVSNADTIDTAKKAHGILQIYLEARVLQSAEQELALFEQAVEAFGAEDYQQAFKDMWGDFTPRIWEQSTIMRGKTSDLLDVIEQTREKPVSPFIFKESASFEIKGVGEAGTIVSRDKLNRTNIHRLKYDNGVLLNYRQTDFKKNEVILAFQFKGDFKRFKQDYIANRVRTQALSGTGLMGMSGYKLKEVLADKGISMQVDANYNRIELKLHTHKESLAEAVEFGAAFITNVNVNTPAWQRQYVMLKSNRARRVASTPLRNLSESSEYLLSDKSTELKFPTIYESKPLQVQKAFAETLSSYFQTGALEIGVIGDFDAPILEESIAKTFAALPDRQPPPETLSTFDWEVSGDIEKTVNHKNAQNQTAIFFCRSTLQSYSIEYSRKVRLISRIFHQKILDRLRQEEGLIYTAVSYRRHTKFAPKFGRFCEGVQINVDDEDRVLEIVDEVNKDMLAGHISKEEFRKVKRARYEHIIDQEGTNIGNLFLVARSQTDELAVQQSYEAASWYKRVKLKHIMPDIKSIFSSEDVFIIRSVMRRKKKRLSFQELIRQAEKGDKGAYLRLARIYVNPKSKHSDIDKAVYWYEQAVQVNAKNVGLELSRLYYLGRDVPKDLKLAAKYSKMSHEAGNIRATGRLAVLYLRNPKVFPEASNAEIFKLFQQGAEGNDKTSQIGLAEMLAQGSMVERDEEAALKWLLIVTNGTTPSIENENRIKRLENALSEEQAASAHELARKWHVTAGKKPKDTKSK